MTELIKRYPLISFFTLPLKLFAVVLLCFFGFSLQPTDAHAQVAETVGPGGEPSETAPSPEVQRILDLVEGRTAPLLRDGTLPGLTLTIVEKDGPTTLRSYGFSDVDDQEPMTPDHLMRIGSVTKTFTAIAILQLVEEGKVDLDAPASRYMKLEPIPDTDGYRQPTVRELLTHRSHLDGDLTDVVAPTWESASEADGWLQRRFRRLAPPGEPFAYDNSAFAALGQILVETDGLPYHEVIDRRVLQPLGMSDTVMGVPASRLSDAAGCYRRFDEELVPCQPEQFKRTYGAAGDLSASTRDMGRYLRALLNQGELDGQRILSPETFAAFTSNRNRIHPMGPGIGLNAYETGPPGHGVFGHAGGIAGGSSLFVVMPEQGLAIFLSTNVDDTPSEPSSLSGTIKLLTSLSDDDYSIGELTSTELSASIPALFASENARSVEGSDNCARDELSGRYAYSRPLGHEALVQRMATAFIPHTIVERTNSEEWTIDGLEPYVEVAPCYFRLRNSGFANPNLGAWTEVGFNRTADGHVFGGPHPLVGYQKVSRFSSAAFTVLPYFLGLVVIIGIGALGTRRRGGGCRSSLFALASGTLVLTSTLLELQFETPLYLSTGQTWIIALWRILWHIGLLLLVAAVVFAIRNIVNREGVKARIGPTILVIASVVVITLGIYWDMLGKIF